MLRVEKTIFLSYRRTNFAWTQALFQDLTQHGFDVFFDYEGIASGDFEQIVFEHIRARAHFLVLLTPSALQRCDDPGDLFRREIEEAIARRRNIVPLRLEGFDFGAPSIAPRLTGKLAQLRKYNALSVPTEYFQAAMTKLREKFLSIELTAVTHPPSVAAQRVAQRQQSAAAASPPVNERMLAAEDWFEPKNSS